MNLVTNFRRGGLLVGVVPASVEAVDVASVAAPASAAPASVVAPAPVAAPTSVATPTSVPAPLAAVVA